MNDLFTAFAFLSSAQAEATIDYSGPLWPYYVAAGAMSSAIVGLFSALMFQNASAKKDFKEVVDKYNAAAEIKAKAHAVEVERLTKALLENSVDFAKLMEKISADLRDLNKKG